MISRDETPIDEAFWRARLDAAIRFRDSLQINATAFRLVHGEADLLPSLIVDRYDDYLVMQTLSQGMDRLAPTLVKLLAEITGAKGILARNDPKVRKLEGLDQKVEVLVRRRAGDDRRSDEAGITYAVDPWRGQKTGLFLDQRENREAAARYAHGRMLDCFSYNGGFGAGPRLEVRVGGGAGRFGGRRRADYRQRRRQWHRQPDGARSQRLR